MNDIEKAVQQMRLSALEQATPDPAPPKATELHKSDTTIIREVDISLGSSNASVTYPDRESSWNDFEQQSAQNDKINSTCKVPLCTLPFSKMKTAGFITPSTAKGKLTEEFRRVKRPLLKNLGEDSINNGLRNVIAVTSAISGEGKTYSAVNLAMSMALEKDRTVLLVDADVVKGAAGKLFSVSSTQPGLTDVLHDESIDLSDIIMQTNVKSLRFMSAGTKKTNTSELLSSDSMSTMIVELARRYDDRIIILDCPPMLQTNEANILADHAGQVVFVVAEEETRQKHVISALEHIERDKYVGILLNKSSSRVGNYDYYNRPYS